MCGRTRMNTGHVVSNKYFIKQFFIFQAISTYVLIMTNQAQIIDLYRVSYNTAMHAWAQKMFLGRRVSLRFAWFLVCFSCHQQNRIFNPQMKRTVLMVHDIFGVCAMSAQISKD